MSVMKILAMIEEVVVNLRSRGAVDAYLFGSAVEPKAAWSDIDILLVCDRDADGRLARRAFLDLCERFPIDLMIMTVDEEREFEFVLSERCRWIARSNPPAGK